MLKQDRREIFHAAAEAQKMADYILGFHPDYSETPRGAPDAEDEGGTPIAPPACGLRQAEQSGAKPTFRIIQDRLSGPDDRPDASKGGGASRATSQTSPPFILRVRTTARRSHALRWRCTRFHEHSP